MEKEVSKRFIEIIDLLGITGYQVAKSIGITSSTISNYRNLVSSPKMKIINDFCEKFGVSKEYLLTGKEPKLVQEVDLPDKTMRFLRVADELKTKRKVSQNEISEVIGSYHGVLSELRNGKTSVKDEWVDRICEVYKVNKRFITEGMGGVFIDNTPSALSLYEQLKELRVANEKLEEYIKKLEDDKEFLKGLLTKHNN